MTGTVASRRSGAAMVALVVGAVSLRPELVSVGPLLPRIQESLEVSHGLAGLVVTIPVLAMGLFAPLAASVAVRTGTRRAIAWALCGIAVFGMLRVLSPGIEVLLLLTLPIGIAMSLANALFPLAVREWFLDRPLGATAGYTTGIQVGAAATSLAAVPLAVALGGWRPSLAAITLTAVLSFLAWVRFAPPSAPQAVERIRPRRLPLRSPLAWRLVAAMGLLGMCFWGVSSWLTDAFLERGWSEGPAAALTAMLNVGAVVGNIAVFVLDERMGSRRAHMLGASILICAGAVLLVLVPGPAFVWAIMLGFGNGLLFPALLTLPLDVSRDAREVAAVTAMMLGFGYGMAGLSPFILGALRDLSGSFTAALWFGAALAAALVVVVAGLSPGRLRHGIRGLPLTPVAGAPTTDTRHL